jgi:hypothetical protein
LPFVPGALTTPASGNPFAESGGNQPLGAATPSLNPYASPAEAASLLATTSPTGERLGLPWENERRSVRGWFRTTKLILGQPSHAFSIMRLSGGMGPPLTYNIYGLGLPLLAGLALVLPFLIVLGAMSVYEEQGGASAAGYAIGMLLGAFGAGAVYALLAATLGSLIGSAVWHACLLACGGGKRGYEATYRATSFAWSSLAWLGFIPYLGGCIFFFWILVLLSVAFSKAHGISTGRAFLAASLPFVLCCGGYVGLILLAASGVLG